MLRRGRRLLEESWEAIWRGQEGVTARLLDLVLLLVLLSGVSWFFERDFTLWIYANPSPFFLVPILIGGKYGTAAGVMGGGCAAFLLIGLTVPFAGQGLLVGDMHEILDESKFPLMALPFVGMLCGEIRNVLYHDAARAGIKLKLATERLRALDEQLFILNEAKEDLDREISLMNADSANLDYEIRRVLQSSEERFFEALLGVFCRKGRLYEAAIYAKGAASWQRAAFAGTSEQWPESLNLQDSAVASKALHAGNIATLPEVWEGRPFEADDYLLACPIGDDAAPDAVLLVRTMDFFAMNERGVQTIRVIAQWVSEFSGLKKKTKGFFDPRKLVEIEDFNHMLDLACVVQKNFSLISSVIIFRNREDAHFTGEDILGVVKSAVRLGDTLSMWPGQTPHLMLLLPLTGRRGAEICATRFREVAGNVANNAANGVELTIDIFCTSDFSNVKKMRQAILESLEAP